jgi:hypothetical protein
MARTVINPANLPCRWPVIGTCVWYLLLEHFNSPGLVWGITGTLVFLAWVLVAIDVFTCKQLPEMKGEE